MVQTSETIRKDNPQKALQEEDEVTARAKAAFAEIKADGKTMRPLQVRRKRQLEALGFSVYCIDNPDQIGEVLNEIQSS